LWRIKQEISIIPWGLDEPWGVGTSIALYQTNQGRLSLQPESSNGFVEKDDIP